MYRGNVLTPKQARAFNVWSLWCDLRVFTGSEVWIVEGAIVGRAAKYGQAMQYADVYPKSEDAAQFPNAPIVPVVLCAFEIVSAANFFSRFGVRTILWTPAWAGESLSNKVNKQVLTYPVIG